MVSTFILQMQFEIEPRFLFFIPVQDLLSEPGGLLDRSCIRIGSSKPGRNGGYDGVLADFYDILSAAGRDLQAGQTLHVILQTVIHPVST